MAKVGSSVCASEKGEEEKMRIDKIASKRVSH